MNQFVNMIKSSEIEAKIINVEDLKTGEWRIQCCLNEDASKVTDKSIQICEDCTVISASSGKLEIPKPKIVGIKKKY